MKLDKEQTQRYRSHILMPEIGGAGQQKICQTSLAVIGAGGIGAPLLLYLAAAGVKKITIIDHDLIARDNLQRQIIYRENDIGKLKAETAKKHLGLLNSNVSIKAIPAKLQADNAIDMLKNCDIIADSSDNYQTRLIASDAAFFLQKPIVMAAAVGYESIIASFKTYATDNQTSLPYPGFRCLYRQNAFNNELDCGDLGVLATTTGIAATMQASVILHYIISGHLHHVNSLLLLDVREMRFEQFRRRHDRSNALTGDNPTITPANIGKN